MFVCAHDQWSDSGVWFMQMQGTDDITNFPQKIANKIKIKTHRKEQMRALFSQMALGCHWSMLAQNS